MAQQSTIIDCRLLCSAVDQSFRCQREHMAAAWFNSFTKRTNPTQPNTTQSILLLLLLLLHSQLTFDLSCMYVLIGLLCTVQKWPFIQMSDKFSSSHYWTNERETHTPHTLGPHTNRPGFVRCFTIDLA